MELTASQEPKQGFSSDPTGRAKMRGGPRVSVTHGARDTKGMVLRRDGGEHQGSGSSSEA